VLATCSILLALLLPVCLVLSLLAKPLVQVALGAKWLLRRTIWGILSF
jgi:PST family polysaccharide transporter